jgi:hypothetical protein
MKIFLAATLAAALLTTPAFSQGRGISVEDFSTGIRQRQGTYCKLALEGDTVYDGLCNVAIRDNTTVIDIGRTKYRIVRDEFEPTQGDFYQVGSQRSLGTVYAKGSCWTGATVRFCAR